VAFAAAAAAQPRPTIAIMPAQYFQADARSADNVTRGLVERFEAEHYQVVPVDRARELFQRMALGPSRNISDTAVLEFGRRLGADLVAHPQLLAVHHWRSHDAASGSPTARAILYLRVLSVRTGSPLYTRQVATTFTPVDTSELTLPLAAAAAAAADVSRSYFERVAGSRQEIHGAAGH
jgi:hypothetical protein